MLSIEPGRVRPAAVIRFGLYAAMAFCGLLGLLATAPVAAQSYRFDTVAGGFAGDGQAATSAGLMTPIGIVFDTAGNLYIAESMTNRIRKVDTSGVITTFAGTGHYGFGGDGGAATAAKFRNPLGMVFDTAGNLYVSDSLNNRVRKIAPSGVITTVAGGGASDTTGDGGLATSAALKRPYGLAFDAAGNLYIAESLAHRVRKVTPAGIISTVAGAGWEGYTGDGGSATVATLYEPTAVTLDAAGNLYIADSRNHAVRRVGTDGTITTAASGITFPYGIATGPDNGIYVSDSDCYIRKLTPTGSIPVVGRGYDPATGDCGMSGDGGPPLSAGIDLPEGIAFDSAGALYFADSSAFRVRKVSGGIVSTVAGRGNFFGDGGLATLATFSTAQGLAVGPDGSLFIADSYRNGRVRKVDPAGIVQTVAGNGAFNSDGDGGPATQAAVFYPRGVMLDPAGNLYITERIGNKVRKVGLNGIIGTVASGLSRPNRTAMDSAGNIYIADTRRNVVQKLSPTGMMTVFAGQQVPYIFKPDYGDGGLATEALLTEPTAIAIDAVGNVYIADSAHMRIRKVDPMGIISTVAGNDPGVPANSGDGGLATQAGLSYPITGLALDLFGNLYIANTLLRKVTADGMISTVKGMDQYAYDVAVDGSGVPYVATLAGTVLKGIRGPTVASDFNGDGYSDVLWRQASTGANAVWPTASLGLGRMLTTVADQNWKAVGSGDFDGDGRADVLWRNEASGTVAVWYSGSYETSRFLAPVPDASWKVVGTGDFDGDGEDDILWRHAQSGANVIWRGADAQRPLLIEAVPDLSWKVVAVGDFGGDGKSDILWRHVSTGAVAIWRSGQYELLAAATDLNWQVTGAGDFDGDGTDDILWQHPGGYSIVWKSARSELAENLYFVADTRWRVQAIGDYDGDGRADILWRHTATAESTIWKGADAYNQQAVATVTDMAWQIVR